MQRIPISTIYSTLCTLPTCLKKTSKTLTHMKKRSDTSFIIWRHFCWQRGEHGVIPVWKFTNITILITLRVNVHKEKAQSSNFCLVFTQGILLQLCLSSAFDMRNQNENRQYLFLYLFISSHHYNSRLLSSMLFIWFWCHRMPGFKKEQNNSCGTLPNDSFTLYFWD